MRRICSKCGSEIPEGSADCPTCQEIAELDRSNARKLSSAIYTGVVIVSAVFAILLISEGIKSFIYELQNERNMIYFPENVIVHVLIPLAYAFFTVMIILRDRSPYLIILPITGIAAETVQLLTNLHDNTISFVTRDSDYYITTVMDFFSAALVVLFLAFMIKMIKEDYNISQSRWMIAASFTLVFAGVVMKLCFIEEYAVSGSLLSYADQTKMYLLFAASLLNVKKRKLNSQKAEIKHESSDK